MTEVRLDHVTKRFGTVTAVRDVNLQIREGEFFTFLGPSGCGKTTTLRMVAGFEQPSDGQIWFDKKDMTSVPPNRRDAGMVFQNYALWPHMTVAENVAFGLQVRRVPKAEAASRVEEALELVRLGGLGPRKVTQLSGGQQQRVALARVLVVRPTILLLDEPLSNLDAKLRLEMRYEIRQLQQRLGITAIYVTHDQSEALAISDRVAVFNQGVVAQVGTPAEVYNRPASAFVAAFIGETNLLPVSSHSSASGETNLVCGDIRLTVTGAVPAGEGRLQAAVRPEHIRVSRERPAGVNVLAARIAMTQLNGTVVVYQIDCAGTRLQATDLYSGRALLESGAEVWLSVDPDQIRLLH